MLHVSPKIVSLVDSEHAIRADDMASRAGLSLEASRSYLSRLERLGRLARRGPDVFTTARGHRPRLTPTPLLKRIGRYLGTDLSLAVVVGWTTEWLAPRAHNAPFRHITVLETPRFTVSSIGDVLTSHDLPALVDPPKNLPDLLMLLPHPIVVWPHADRYATVSNDHLLLPEPERLVVDFYFAVKRHGLPYPDNDLAVALGRFIDEGDLNVGTILSYAARRAIAVELGRYLIGLPRIPDDLREAMDEVLRRKTAAVPA